MRDTSQSLQANLPADADAEFSVATINSQPRHKPGRPRGSHTDRISVLKIRCTPAEHRQILGLLAQVLLNEYPQERPVATILVEALRENTSVTQAERDQR